MHRSATPASPRCSSARSGARPATSRGNAARSDRNTDRDRAPALAPPAPPAPVSARACPAAGPCFHYWDTWQLVINTATTVITFLVVFLIQNTQNRDARALHLKLDEVIRAIRSARNEMISIEHLSDEELEGLTKHYDRLRAECEARRKREDVKA
ncbi:MAG: hypothetical protein DMF23_10085 [Verrucomicrobia bacterium]|nr:MAG: hypothetical protein DMF23_10085 [Verrucomicrobiota bacterium]